jgi:alkylhydroperoxidase family enzyme
MQQIQFVMSSHPPKGDDDGTKTESLTASSAAMQPWIDLGKTIQNDGLEPLVKQLVMTRASQINGCSFWIHYHTSDAR